MGEYRLELREFETEESWFDQIQMLAVDHDPEVGVVLDEAGRIRTYRGRTLPHSARDQYGEEQVALLDSLDGVYYEGDSGSSIELHFESRDFEVPAGKTVDHCSGALNENDQQKAEPSILVRVPDSTGIEGWREIRVIHPRENFAPSYTDLTEELDLLRDDPRVQLYWTARHDLDQVSFTWDSEDAVAVDTLPLLGATDPEEMSVVSELVAGDGTGVRLAPGESISLSFDAPPTDPGMKRDLLLIVGGLYETVGGDEETGKQPIGSGLALEVWNGGSIDDGVRIHYRLPEDEKEIGLSVYSVQGRLVKTLVSDRRGRGSHAVRWDGRDNSGRDVGSGIYFVRLQYGDDTRTRKTVIIR